MVTASEGLPDASRYSDVHAFSMAEDCTGALQEHAYRLVEDCNGALHTTSPQGYPYMRQGEACWATCDASWESGTRSSGQTASCKT